ncbi:MAG: cysteine peptidase family C39 domain-containing protein [Nostoc sp.]|uniref:cysteine peptidase family C39 domain-containing protein n=1 Tax=Nostoc sp. TaxID=1180 RepID=UPI002FFACEAA
MINQYWGIRLNLYNLRNLDTGVFLQGLAKVAQTLVYEALLVRQSFTKLDSYYNPWIANWQEIHYVVVWKVRGDRTLISDSAICFRIESLNLAGSFT